MSLTNIIIDIKEPVKKSEAWWVVEYRKQDYWEKKFFMDVSRAYNFYADTKRQIEYRQHFNER